MRIINFEHFQAHTNPLFNNLKILKLKDVFHLKMLKFVYDYKKKNLPHVLNTLLKKIDMTHSHNTRGMSNKNLFIPAFNSIHFGNWTLKYQCPYLWNKISSEVTIDTDVSKKTFSKNIKEFLIKQYDND